MSMSPSTLLARLDELKKWQNIQQERLLKSHHKRLEETNRDSDHETIQGLSEYDSTNIEESYDEESPTKVVCNKEVIKAPKNPKPNEVEEAPTNKKPFLRRGEGLAKFGMRAGDQKRPFNKFKVPKTIIHKRLSDLRKNQSFVPTNESVSDMSQPVINKPQQNIKNVEVIDITPLKMPNINVQPKAKWCSINEINCNEPVDNNEVIYKINDLASQNEPKTSPQPTNVINADLLMYLKQLAAQKFGYSSVDSSDVSKFGETTLELHNFEALEEKVQQSSFCSTNSSVVQLLSSTPHKKAATIETIPEKKVVHFNQTTPPTKNVKKSLHFNEIEVVSDESSVTSEDFEDRTIQNQNWAGRLQENSNFSETTSTCSSIQSDQHVIIKQNAAVMTDDLDYFNQCDIDDVLRRKLAELDEEIAKFRAENNKLQKSKSELENERKLFERSKKQLEKDLQEQRINLEYELGEEKKRLIKEKMVFERYVKDLQNKPSKKEREEISTLKTELANVKETLKLKETRNGTSQARLRNQLKAYEKDNGNLKEEVEKLQKTNAKLIATQKVARKPSETKMLHEINKNLTKLTLDTKVSKQINKLEKSIEKEVEINDSLIYLEETTKKPVLRKKSTNYETEYKRSFSGQDTRKNVEKDSDNKQRVSKDKTNLHQELDAYTKQFESNNKEIEDEKRFSADKLEIRRTESDPTYTRRFSNNSNKDKLEILRNSDDLEDFGYAKRFSNPPIEPPIHKDNLVEVYKKHLIDTSEETKRKSNEFPQNIETLFHKRFSNEPNDSLLLINNNARNSQGKENDKNKQNFDVTGFQNLSDLSLIRNYERVFGTQERNLTLNDTQASQSGKIETVLPDGSKETKYPNGNVKIISADAITVKMKYFNGDVKESNLYEGSVKYFYKESNLWQTTLKDGTDILEFHDGQIEKKFVDGTSECKFPNGVNKITQKDGTEKLTYPDGSIVTMKGEDEKILELPNGQKEIHTKEHKRREYPDGTVKIIYPDGLQETRYSNGRIRLKDINGKLIMDSHQDLQ